jgi:hypothetical protein
LALSLPSRYLNDGGSLDIFEIAPALRRVILLGSYPGDGFRLLLPWSQITHFYDMLLSESVAPYLPLSSLTSLSYLYIDKNGSQSPSPFAAYITPTVLSNPSTYPSHYEPITLSVLRSLKIHGHSNGDTGTFLDSLTIPAIEDIKISFPEPGSLVPRLVSMFSRSHGPSRLQTLAFRTIPLKTGQLSTLLNLIPQLIELDISVPPLVDILRLIDCEGEVILVPMLRALYMHDVDGFLWAGYFKRLAQVRCELGGKDSEDAIKPLLASRRNTLDMFRIVFNSIKNRNVSQSKLNNWSFVLRKDEALAASMLSRWSERLSTFF